MQGALPTRLPHRKTLRASAASTRAHGSRLLATPTSCSIPTPFPVPSPGEPDALSVSSSASLASTQLPGEAAATPRPWPRGCWRLARPGGRGHGRSWARTATARGGDTALRPWVPGPLLHAGDRRAAGCATCLLAAFPSSSCCCCSASSSGADRRKRR